MNTMEIPIQFNSSTKKASDNRCLFVFYIQDGKRHFLVSAFTSLSPHCSANHYDCDDSNNTSYHARNTFSSLCCNKLIDFLSSLKSNSLTFQIIDGLIYLGRTIPPHNILLTVSRTFVSMRFVTKPHICIGIFY